MAAMAQARGCGIARCVSTALLLQYAAALTVVRDAPLKFNPDVSIKIARDAPLQFNADLSLKEAGPLLSSMWRDSAFTGTTRKAPDATLHFNPDLSIRGAPKPMGFVDPKVAANSRQQMAPPGVITDASITTAATCSTLQNRISIDINATKHLKNISCKLLAGFNETTRSRGCECRLLKEKATGGACPYDCTSSGVPGCVDGAAKELGLTGITPGEPVSVPTQVNARGRQNSEAFTCTYWKFTVDMGGVPTSEAEERARLSGRVKFMELMKKISGEVEPKVDKKLAAMEKPAKFDFQQSLKGVSDGGAKAWGALGHHPNEAKIWDHVKDAELKTSGERLAARSMVARRSYIRTKQ